MTRNLVLIQPVGFNPDALVALVQNLPQGVTPTLTNTTGMDFEACVKEYEKILDKKEIRSFTVCGHGSGAAVAVKLASRAPGRVEKLILSSPQLYADERSTEVQLKALKWMPGFLFKGAKKSLQQALEFSLGIDVREELTELLKAGTPPVTVLGDDNFRELIPSAEYKNVTLADPAAFAAELA